MSKRYKEHLKINKKKSHGKIIKSLNRDNMIDDMANMRNAIMMKNHYTPTRISNIHVAEDGKQWELSYTTPLVVFRKLAVSTNTEHMYIL